LLSKANKKFDKQSSKVKDKAAENEALKKKLDQTEEDLEKASDLIVDLKSKAKKDKNAID